MVLVSLTGEENWGQRIGKAGERREGRGKEEEKERTDNLKLTRYYHIKSLGERMLETASIPCKKILLSKTKAYLIN